jgi:hypothetical protein
MVDPPPARDARQCGSSSLHVDGSRYSALSRISEISTRGIMHLESRKHGLECPL